MSRPIVKENTAFERDTASKAVLNRDDRSYQKALKRREFIKKIKTLETRVEELEAMVAEIKRGSTRLR